MEGDRNTRIWLKTEKKEYGNTENHAISSYFNDFTDLSWLLEITVVVPEHLSLFLFACRGYSVHSTTICENGILGATSYLDCLNSYSFILWGFIIGTELFII